MNAYEALLRNFCQTVGIDEADAVVASGEVMIDGIGVALLQEGEDGESLTLFADLGIPDSTQEARLYRQLLEANFLWQGTGGAVLGVHPASAAIGLAARLDFEGLDAALLAEAIERFVIVAAHWQGVMQSGPAADAAPADAAMAMLRV